MKKFWTADKPDPKDRPPVTEKPVAVSTALPSSPSAVFMPEGVRTAHRPPFSPTPASSPQLIDILFLIYSRNMHRIGETRVCKTANAFMIVTSIVCGHFLAYVGYSQVTYSGTKRSLSTRNSIHWDLESLQNTEQVFCRGSQPSVAPEPPGGLVNPRRLGPGPQRFWFGRSRVRAENLHFQQVLVNAGAAALGITVLDSFLRRRTPL